MIIQLSLVLSFFFFFTQHHSQSRFVLLKQSLALIYSAAFFLLVSHSLRLKGFNSDDSKLLHGEELK